MSARQTASIQRFAGSRADIVAASRFLANPNVDLDALRDAICEPVAFAEGRVLVIEDTTEINLTRHAGRLRARDPHLGPITADDHVGFFVHPALVVDEASGVPLGLAALDIRNRDWTQPDKHARRYASLPIEQKESSRWLESADDAKRRLVRAEHRTVICDREGDIYDLFAAVPDARTTLLVRSRSNRRLATGGATGDDKLHDVLAEAPGVASTLEVARSGPRARRTATTEVRFAAVEVRRPKRAARHLPERLPVWAVEVREVDAPEREEPVLWRLLTSAPVTSVTEALAVASTYARRWQRAGVGPPEELFRTVKSQGLDLEASQVSTGLGLKKLCVLAVHAAVQVLALVAERDGASGVSARVLFSASEVACLTVLSASLAGSTAKQRNPHPPESLAWAGWVIARLGGWHGYGSPPGPARMRRGLSRFADQWAGWSLTEPLWAESP